MNKKPRILVTAALPYANGSIHLGHMVEHIQTDIWVRLQKLLGRDCIFVCADDAHGTAIMIGAQKQGITPEQLIAKIHTEHQKDFADFYIHYDNYGTTHSEENKTLSVQIYESLKKNGDITVRTIEQFYDPVENIFLPDRYIKGECPRCGAKDQYGDNCEACGATYPSIELKNPVSIISGATPIRKESEHYFFQLENYKTRLHEWINAGHIQEAVARKLMEWFDTELQAWDISRDAPYFGFEIPDAPGKYFYVWLDAPVGYMASFKQLCQRSNLNFDDYWQENSQTELYHFIGKDIVYFHALFWPAMLMGSHFRTPTNIFVHGFLTINGQKMSKSRGTFINARTYLNHLNPEYLRYYFASKLSNNIEDIDINFADFMQRINSDLVGKVVNIASRCASFINKLFTNKLSASLHKPELFNHFVTAGDKIANLYTARDYNQAVREIMALADQANQYVDEMKPWALAKQSGQEQLVCDVCTMGLNLFKILLTYLKPILPHMAEQVEIFLNIPAMSWENRSIALLNHSIETFTPLLQRIQSEQIEAMLNAETISQ